MHKTKLLLILGFFFSCFAFADENKDIVISNVWMSEAPPTVYILAAYAKIQNTSTEIQELTSVSSPSFSTIELHLSKVVNDIAKMEKQDSLSIPANDSIALSPGAYHLMLFSPTSPLKAGDTAKITFNFANGASNTVEAMVKKRSINEHDHSHNHDHDHNEHNH